MEQGQEAPFSEVALRNAVADATSWADVLRTLGYEVKGHNYRTVQKWAGRWEISTGHFNPNVGRSRSGRTREKPLSEVMVQNSSYSRGTLKERLFATGLKDRRCEICGQSELWRGRRMSLVLDHINGVSNDHRLENLRIVCPNCAATLDTHCGRNLPRERSCPSCGERFAPRDIRHRYCSSACWGGGGRASLARLITSRDPEGRATLPRAVEGGHRRDEHARRRPQVRGFGQRGAQVDPLV